MTEKLNLPKGMPGARPTCVAFSKDSTRVASTANDERVRVFDSRTGRILWEPDLPPHGVPGRGYGLWSAFGPDGLLAVNGSENQLIWIWDERNRKIVAQLGTKEDGYTAAMQFTPDGRYLLALVASRNYASHRITNRFSLWEIKRRVGDAAGAVEDEINVMLVNTQPAAYGVWPPSFALSPDRRHFAFVDTTGSTSPQNTLNLWPLDAGASPRHLSTNLSFTFTPDGRQLLTIGRACEVAAVDAETGATVSPAFSVVLPNSPPEDPQGRRLVLSPDGMKLAISSADRLRVDIWNWRTRHYLYSLPEQEGMITDTPVWSPDSHHLAARYFDGSTVVWNIEAVEQLLAELGLRL